jgi:hypothetical protein
MSGDEAILVIVKELKSLLDPISLPIVGATHGSRYEFAVVNLSISRSVYLLHCLYQVTSAHIEF